jgi:hypothetical protein
MKNMRLKIAAIVLILLTGCQASDFQKPTSLGYVKPDKTKTPDQQKLDMGACIEQARSATDTKENLSLRAGVTMVPFLNSVLHNTIDESDKVKQRSVFKQCMGDKGYEIIPADDDKTSQYNYGVPSPKAQVKVSLPAGWGEQKISPNLAFGNVFFYALNKSKDTGMIMSFAKLEDATDAKELAKARLKKQADLLTNSSQTDISSVNINGITFQQAEVTGDSKSGYRQRFTYLSNVTKGKEEYISLSFWALADNYEKNKEEFLKILNSVTGL